MTNIRSWFWAICASVWFGAICYWSSLATTETPLYGVPDFIRHGCVFGLLGFFVFMSVYRWLTPYTATLLLVLFAGLLDEIHQSFVPTRGFDPLDLLADVVGASLVLVGLIVLQKLTTMFWKISFKEMPCNPKG